MYLQEKVSLYSEAERFVVLFFTIVWVPFMLVVSVYIVDCYNYVEAYMYSLCKHIWVSMW